VNNCFRHHDIYKSKAIKKEQAKYGPYHGKKAAPVLGSPETNPFLLKQTMCRGCPVLISFLASTILFILSAHLLDKRIFRKLFLWIS